VDGASDDYDNLEIKRADAAKSLAIKNGLLEAGIEKQHAEEKAARIKEYAKNLEEVDVQTELYVAIHEYVTRYEEFLTAQASCWTRWRTFGSTKLDKLQLADIQESMKYYENLAVQALRLLATRAQTVIRKAATDGTSPVCTVARDVFVNKMAEELGLSEKSWTFEELVMAKMVCERHLYRPTIISRLVRLMSS
jgi:hypothetical protein